MLTKLTGGLPCAVVKRASLSPVLVGTIAKTDTAVVMPATRSHPALATGDATASPHTHD